MILINKIIQTINVFIIETMFGSILSYLSRYKIKIYITNHNRAVKMLLANNT